MKVDEAKVLRGYLTALLWAETDDNDDPLDKNYSRENVSEDSIKIAKKEIHSFLEKAGDLVLLDDKSPDEIGHDICLTRNGYGAGFWDGDYPNAGDKLSEIASAMGEYYVYVDGGELHIVVMVRKSKGAFTTN